MATGSTTQNYIKRFKVIQCLVTQSVDHGPAASASIWESVSKGNS